MVRFGFRIPSLKKRLAARTSLKRYVRHSFGIEAPRGWGWLTNPRKAAYNRVYNRTTRGCLVVVGAWAALGLAGIAAAAVLVRLARRLPRWASYTTPACTAHTAA
jgi:hypothetical protein